MVRTEMRNGEGLTLQLHQNRQHGISRTPSTAHHDVIDLLRDSRRLSGRVQHVQANKTRSGFGASRPLKNIRVQQVSAHGNLRRSVWIGATIAHC